MTARTVTKIGRATARPKHRSAPTKAPTREADGASALFIPPIAVCVLHDNPRLAPQFDAKYGNGMAAKYLAVH